MQHPSLRGAAAATAATVLAAVALAGPAAAAIPAPTSPSPYVPQGTPVSPGTQGISMRDGGVCDPIRHMGC